MGRKKINRVGEKHPTTQYGEITIIECFDSGNCTVQFDDGTILKNIGYGNIVRMRIRNPNTPSLFNTGYIGQGKYTVQDNFKKFTNCYNMWSGIIRRCYSKVCQQRQPTYIGCSVDKRWYNFQVFGAWYEENWKPYMVGWALDKDILFKGNKIYSSETCCFVPAEINALFTKCNSVRGKYPIGVTLWKKEGTFSANLMVRGVKKYLGTFNTSEEAFYAYKEAKEKYIKEVADEWKPLIKTNVYKAMYNYKVEITD